MAICPTCESYYKPSKFNSTCKCDECAHTVELPYFDEEDALEVEHLINPNGRVQPKFYE